ncbi:hypothetical protein GGD50_006569 [Rhizobium paranaense]|uniref:Uncharacterized protein n=1 Tax=Rhizobium paranaense TaxID=1650438 RepID=A0A7W8XYH4_9HYPH|nr:hypothetical protein [Rhizobium paranaense]
MPVFERGKYGALAAYIVLAILVPAILFGCVLIAGAIVFHRHNVQRPGQTSPHALDQSQS